jgi:hypothetical protein
VTCAREYRFEQDVIDQIRSSLRRLDVPADLFARLSRQLEEARKHPR